MDLGGFFLTDNLTNKFQFEIPNNGRYVIPPGGFLLVWADGETGQNSTNRADLHASFNLRAAGEAIGLFAADGTPIDAVTFGQQTNNVSMGRSPDGSNPIVFLSQPSPRPPTRPGPPPEVTDIAVSGRMSRSPSPRSRDSATACSSRTISALRTGAISPGM